MLLKSRTGKRERERATWNWEQGTWSREQGTGNREQGTGSREQGTGNREQETGNRKQETGNRKQETGNRKQGTGNREQGTTNRERRMRIWERVCSGYLPGQSASLILQFHFLKFTSVICFLLKTPLQRQSQITFTKRCTL